MHKKLMGWLMAIVTIMWVPMVAEAQTTGTNMITLISDNTVNARDTLVPLGIGLTVLFIAIALGVKLFRKTVK